MPLLMLGGPGTGKNTTFGIGSRAAAANSEDRRRAKPWLHYESLRGDACPRVTIILLLVLIEIITITTYYHYHYYC